MVLQGQRRPVNVYFLCCRGTYDERHWQRLTSSISQVTIVEDGPDAGGIAGIAGLEGGKNTNVKRNRGLHVDHVETIEDQEERRDLGNNNNNNDNFHRDNRHKELAAGDTLMTDELLDEYINAQQPAGGGDGSGDGGGGGGLSGPVENLQQEHSQQQQQQQQQLKEQLEEQEGGPMVLEEEELPSTQVQESCINLVSQESCDEITMKPYPLGKRNIGNNNIDMEEEIDFGGRPIPHAPAIPAGLAPAAAAAVASNPPSIDPGVLSWKDLKVMLEDDSLSLSAHRWKFAVSTHTQRVHFHAAIDTDNNGSLSITTSSSSCTRPLLLSIPLEALLLEGNDWPSRPRSKAGTAGPTAATGSS